MASCVAKIAPFKNSAKLLETRKKNNTFPLSLRKSVAYFQLFPHCERCVASIYLTSQQRRYIIRTNFLFISFHNRRPTLYFINLLYHYRMAATFGAQLANKFNASRGQSVQPAVQATVAPNSYYYAPQAIVYPQTAVSYHAQVYTNSIPQPVMLPYVNATAMHTFNGTAYFQPVNLLVQPYPTTGSYQTMPTLPFRPGRIPNTSCKYFYSSHSISAFTK
jgi:hypothetical protein